MGNQPWFHPTIWGALGWERSETSFGVAIHANPFATRDELQTMRTNGSVIITNDVGTSMPVRPARILFARHGESTANLLRVIANRASEHPLTELGRAQAVALAEAARPEHVERIFTSPIRRAAETAEIVGRALGVPVESADALREFDCGEYEGRSDAAAWQAHAAAVRDWLELDRPDSRLRGGESLTDMRARFEPFVAAVIRDLLGAGRERGDPNPRAVLLISHGGLLRCVLPPLLDGVDRALARGRYLGNAELIGADIQPDGTLTGRAWPAAGDV